MRGWETLKDIDGEPNEKYEMLLATIWNGLMRVAESMGGEQPDETRWTSPNDFSIGGKMQTLFKFIASGKKPKLDPREAERQNQSRFGHG